MTYSVWIPACNNKGLLALQRQQRRAAGRWEFGAVAAAKRNAERRDSTIARTRAPNDCQAGRLPYRAGGHKLPRPAIAAVATSSSSKAIVA